jgi:hypothetical protein
VLQYVPVGVLLVGECLGVLQPQPLHLLVLRREHLKQQCSNSVTTVQQQCNSSTSAMQQQCDNSVKIV